MESKAAPPFGGGFGLKLTGKPPDFSLFATFPGQGPVLQMGYITARDLPGFSSAS